MSIEEGGWDLGEFFEYEKYEFLVVFGHFGLKFAIFVVFKKLSY